MAQNDLGPGTGDADLPARDGALDGALDRPLDGESIDPSDAGDPGDRDAQPPEVLGSDGLAKPRRAAQDFTGEVNKASFAGGFTSWSRGLARAGDALVAVNPDSDSVTLLRGTPLAVVAEIPVGRDPRSVAITADGRYAAVVNRGDATVSIVALGREGEGTRELFYFATQPMPYGAVIDDGRVIVTEWATGQVAGFDIGTRRLVARVHVGPFPAGIANCAPPCALSGGSGLLVTHFYDGRLSRLDRETLQVRTSISTGADTNFSQQVAIAPDGARAYLPQTRSFADNPVRQFDSTVFPVVNVIELATLRLDNAARITLDTADRPVALPFAVEFLSDGQRLAVANAGSDDLSIIDLATGRKVAHVPVGASPQGLATSQDGGTLYANQVLDGRLAVIHGGTFAPSASVFLTTLPLSPLLLAGKRLFWSATRTDLARDQWMSCATCHFDGFHDGRTWRSFPDGPRNTTALFDLEETLPLHWSGDLDEVADVESTVRFIQAGTGLAPAPQIDTLGTPLAGVDAELDALSAFLRTLRAPLSPYRGDSDGIARGRTVFERLACASCHAGPHFTDRRNHDVGTGDPALERNGHGRGLTFDTPTLKALWLTPPYLHDGSAPTLEAVFARGKHQLPPTTTDPERAALVTYLRSL